MPDKFVADFEYTPAELLALCNQAIAEILACGRSYAIRGREMNRANLSDLYVLRRELNEQISAADYGGIATNQMTRGRL